MKKNVKSVSLFVLLCTALLHAGKCIKQDLAPVSLSGSGNSFSMNEACRAMAVWPHDATTSNKIFARYFNGDVWQGNVEVSDDTNTHCASVSINNLNKAVAVWLSDELGVRVASFDGMSWSTPISVSADDSSEFVGSRVGLDDNGNAIVVWQDGSASDTGGKIRTSRSTDGGLTWSPVDTLSENGAAPDNNVFFDSVQADSGFSMSSNGRGVVLWSAVTVPDSPLTSGLQAAIFDRASWHKPNETDFVAAPVENKIYVSRSVSINNNGQIAAAWSFDRTTAQGTFHNGVSWEPVTDFESLVTANITEVGSVSVSINDNGRALVVWLSTLFEDSVFVDAGLSVQYISGQWQGIGLIPGTWKSASGTVPIFVCNNDADDGGVVASPDGVNTAASAFNGATNAWIPLQATLFQGRPGQIGCAKSSANGASAGVINDSLGGMAIALICCNTQLPLTVSPPSGISGRRALNHFAMQAEAFAELRWDLSQDSDIFSQNIYRDGTLIANVPAIQTTFVDHNLSLPLPSRYAVTAVNRIGLESLPEQLEFDD